MARAYGRIKTSIWNDDDFRELDDAAQALYLRLLSAPTMTLAGVCDWRPKRQAILTKGMTVRGVESAGRSLEERHYIVIDEDTDEVLVRTFVKHEGVVANPKTAAGLVGAFGKVTSVKLRLALSLELNNLRDAEPDLKGWDYLSDALGYASDRLCETMPSGIRLGIASPIGSDTDEVSDWGPIPLKPESLNQKPETDDLAAGRERFEEFWSIYPSRGQHANPKKPAKAKWDLLIRRGEDPEAIIAGARRLAESRKGQDPQHTPQATTWLNQERWKDEPASVPAQAPNMNEWFLLK